jgi:hypothetical protein
MDRAVSAQAGSNSGDTLLIFFGSMFLALESLPGRRSILSMKGFRCNMKMTNPD